MTRVIEGKITAKDLKVAVIVSRFNTFITERLLEGCIDTLVRHGAEKNDITVIRVPGAFEIPGVLNRVVAGGKGRYDAVICLGAVIRGGTPHFDYISSEVSKGIAAVSLNSAMPVSFGVLTCDTIEQAIERAGTKAGNKGVDAALSAIEMASLYRELNQVS